MVSGRMTPLTRCPLMINRRKSESYIATTCSPSSEAASSHGIGEVNTVWDEDRDFIELRGRFLARGPYTPGACGQQKDHQCQGATKHFCFSRCRHVRFLVRDVVASRDAVQMCVAATQDAAVVSGTFLSAFRRTAFLIMQRLLLSYPRRLAEENKNICLNWRRARPSRSVWQHSHSQFCGQSQYLCK